MTTVTLIVPDWVGFFIAVLCWLLAASMLTDALIAWMRARAQKKATADFERILRDAAERIIRSRGEPR